MPSKKEDCCPPSETEPSSMPDEDVEELAALAKAVGHPIRIKILNLLDKNDNCICGEIVDELPLAQSTISQHLKVLKEAGLVRGEIAGPSVCYCIDKKRLKRLKVLVAGL